VVLVSTIALWSCEESEDATPVVNTDASNLTANFHLINAVPGLASLDLFVNNVKVIPSVTTGVGALNYTRVAITTNNIGNNTSMKGRPTSSTFGGVLGSADAIFRAGNNNANNLQAASGARYTAILLDSLTRPAPIRTLNAGNFGDTTFFNRSNGQYISTVQRAALTGVQKQQLVPIGIVPLGNTDRGGPRFVLLTDALTTAFPSPNLTQSGIRFINAIPNAANPLARGMVTSASTVTGLTARLVGPGNPNLGTNINYIMAFTGAATGGNPSSTFQPSVGSRSTTVSFSARNTATAGVADTYTLEIVRHLGGSGSADTSPQAVLVSIPGLTFEAGRYYTIVASGIIGKTGDSAPKVSIIRHDNPNP
jgi:hypothetical protein